jgi:hypothetical protein
MVERTMKWVSSAQEFGFLSPTDGTRDVFVCLLTDSGLRDLSRNLTGQASLDALELLPEIVLPTDVRRAGDEG